MNENELNQLEIDILDKMSLDNEEDKEFKEWYKNNKNGIKNHIKNVSLAVENHIIEEKVKLKSEEIKKEDNSISNNSLPIRADEKYTRIEGYEDYEFTHCIAYEMAIRNKNIKKLTNTLEKLNSLSFDIFSNFSSELKIEDKMDCLGKKLNTLISLSKTLNFNNPHEEISEIYHKFSTDLNNNHKQIIKEKFMQIIDENKKDYFISIIKKYQDSNVEHLLSKYEETDLEKLFNKANFEEQLHLIEVLKNSIQDKLAYEYYIVNEEKSITPKNIEEFIDKNTNYEPTPEINYHINAVFTNPNYKQNYIHEKNSGYIAYQGTYEKDNSFTINKVIPNFSQPLRMFNTMDISINPSLPLNDILSFVKKIKEDYDTNNSFKSFFELVEDGFTNSENTTIKSKIKFDKSRWADLFYIYDYFKFRKDQSKPISDIAEELSFQLTFYYNKLHNKTNPNKLKPIPENLTNGKLDFDNFSYTKEHDFDNELYLNADHIRKFDYKKISSLIEGENPEYKKLIGGKNHDKNSLIDGKNNDSSRL